MTSSPFKKGDKIKWFTGRGDGPAGLYVTLLEDPDVDGWAMAMEEGGRASRFYGLDFPAQSRYGWWEYDERPVVSGIDGDW